MVLSYHLYQNNWSFDLIYTLSEETDTEDSRNSLSDVSYLYDDFSRMQFESSNTSRGVIDEDGSLRKKLFCEKWRDYSAVLRNFCVILAP